MDLGQTLHGDRMGLCARLHMSRPGRVQNVASGTDTAVTLLCGLRRVLVLYCVLCFLSSGSHCGFYLFAGGLLAGDLQQDLKDRWGDGFFC